MRIVGKKTERKTNISLFPADIHTYKPECDIPVPGIPVPGNSSIFLMVSEPVSKKFGTEKSLGTGLEKIWYRKKSRNLSRKILVPKKNIGASLEIF